MRRVIGALAMLCLLAGLAAVCYWPVRSWLGRQQQQQAVTSFRQELAEQETAPAADAAGSGQSLPYPDLFADMQTYNRQLYATGQSGLVDAWSYEQPAFDLSGYGLETDVIGVLSIPAMGEELPVYLGATQDNLGQGVAVLGQTSMPVSGENTNCVIAGHRGYKGKPVFREIERLQPGDMVYLTTCWEDLEYQVEAVALIEPDDIDAVLIQPGRQMLTLITCHPYTVGTQRYVVYCTRTDPVLEDSGSAAAWESTGENPLQNAGSGTPEPVAISDSSQGLIRLERWAPLAAIPLVIVILALLWPRKRGGGGRAEKPGKEK